MLFGLTLTFLVSQIFAGIAMISDILSFQFKARKHIIIFFLISASCISAHYFLLERYVAGVLIAIGIIRFIIAYFRIDRYWMYIFITIYTLTTIILYKDIFDILILLGMSLSTIASFQKDDKPLRQLMMSATTCSIFYNIFVFTPIGILLECIFLASNFVGYWRHYIRKNKLGKR